MKHWDKIGQGLYCIYYSLVTLFVTINIFNNKLNPPKKEQ